MNEKINLIKADGTAVQADVICFLKDTESSKIYLYNTLNEIDSENKNVKIYVSKIRQNDPALDTPITDEEWNKLKGIMGEVLKGTPNATIQYLPLTDLTETSVVSDRVIAMPISYDYINKHRGVYAQTVATAPAPEAPAAAPESAPVTPEVEPVPEVPAPTIEPAPAVEPTPAVESTPATEPVPEVPAAELAPAPEALAVPTPEVIPQAPLISPTVETVAPSKDTDLKPVDTAEIKAKYDELRKNIDELEKKELEAAERYNATLELSAMHNEQHAEYVANEKSNETVTPEAPAPVAEPVVAAPVAEQEPAPTADMIPPVPKDPNAPIIPVMPGVESVTVEPTPVEVSAPTPEAAPAANIETNWFDMPVQQ